MKNNIGKFLKSGCLFALISVFLVTSSAEARTFKLKGKVNPKMEGVEIAIHGDKLSEPQVVTTSTNGKFKVVLEEGNYVVYPSKEGFNFNPSAKTIILERNTRVTFTDVEAYGDDIIALHDVNSAAYRRDCTTSECHEGILTEVTLDPDIKTAHVLMLDFSIGDTVDEKCTFCHISTDVINHSAEVLRKNVDPMLCATCHGPDSISTQYYQVSK